MYVRGFRETGVLVVLSSEDFMYIAITEWWNYSENVAILA